MSQPIRKLNAPPDEREIDELGSVRDLADEVTDTGEPLMLTQDGEPIAIVAPYDGHPNRKRRKKTKPAGSILELAGAWSDMTDSEAEDLIRRIYEARDASNEPPLHV